MESILTSIKKLLGISEEYEHFDTDIIMHINSVFMVLSQLGVGPTGGFAIKDKTATWESYMANMIQLEAVKSYMGVSVRLLFDPPTSSAHIEALKQQKSELEWRINANAEYNIGGN